MRRLRKAINSFLKRKKKKESRFDPWIFISLVLTGALILSLKNPSPNFNLFQSKAVTVNPVLAEEIYPLFFCPCCGQPLDKNKICCGQAKERIDYIDSLVQAKISKDEVVLAYVKKYGLNSFVDKNKQDEIKDKLIAQAPAERPKIVILPESFDLGDVSQKKGITTTFFELKNEGNKELGIDRLETSCGCTSASIVYQGKEGPAFTMPGHGKENPTDWQIAIPSGETAKLKIYYDPNVHQEFRGAVTREISVFSNDPIDFEKKVKVELNQVD